MLSAIAFFTFALAQVPTPSASPAPAFSALQWRCIGPFRGGRTVGAAGIADQPNTFFIGVNNGGVWKTTDAGRTWRPIFDDQPTGSIGAIALAPSNPKIIYVGSGEGLQRPDLSTGDGMYRSDDGGATWRSLGLSDAQQVASIIVDPSNPNRLFVAALGHPFGPNEQRGVFRCLDGGASGAWETVLFADPDTGAVALAFDPTDPNIIYADLWESRQAPWENGAFGDTAHGTGSSGVSVGVGGASGGNGLYKSIDGGTTWHRLTTGLPTREQGLGRIGFAISPSNPKRMYATVDASAPRQGGIYRSDDAGESWIQVSSQRRLWGRGSDFAEVRVHPSKPDTLFVANTSLYRSDDAGKTYACIKGSPGGDDYHTLWINPLHPEIMLLAGDQGAAITVNDAETWSSWYNQPTAQLFHVITDNQNPYWVYGSQQESGSAGICSRGIDGQITFREWHPVGGDEYSYFAPDPLNNNIIYGAKVTRYHRNTGVVEQVGPDRKKLDLRYLRTAPLIFSPVEHKTLYLGAQVLLRTRDAGVMPAPTWEVISPDLSREHPDVPECIGKYRTPELSAMKRRGVIYTIAPSCLDADTIWCGTDDGLIHITTDGGKNWKDVTPNLTAWSKVSLIDAGHFDAKTAYAAINRLRVDDLKPHIYKTHDGGATWKEIVGDLPQGPVNAVREDPKRPGLLFCATELAVFFSLDDGEHWKSLRQNMPATSIRDVVIHEDDLVVGTHGRSIWILDNFSLLRQLPATGAGPDTPTLFPPPPAYQFPRNVNTDTPLPPEEPAGKNPPDGAMIDYYLPRTAASITLEIIDASGATLRQFSSADAMPELNPDLLTVMPQWALPPQRLDASQGGHRFIWDLRLPRPPQPASSAPAASRPDVENPLGSLPISAIWRSTPFYPLGDWVKPATYTIRMIVDGTVLEQKIQVMGDPRK